MTTRKTPKANKASDEIKDILETAEVEVAEAASPAPVVRRFKAKPEVAVKNEYVETKTAGGLVIRRRA